MKYDTVVSCDSILLSKILTFPMERYTSLAIKLLKITSQKKESSIPIIIRTFSNFPARWFKIYEINPIDYDVHIESF